jgi:CheY-like chemotaxis protein
LFVTAIAVDHLRKKYENIAVPLALLGGASRFLGIARFHRIASSPAGVWNSAGWLMYVRPIEAYRPGVLVIDNSAAVRNGIENALSLRGLLIFGASGPRNIQAAVQAKQVDLVLADLVADCDELAAAIRDIAKRNPRAVPIVAMSQRDMWENLEIFSAADAIGATAVLRKPFSQTALIQLLSVLLPSRRVPLNMAVEGCAEDIWSGMH